MQIEILNCSESDSRRDSNCSSLTGFADSSALDDGPDDRLHVTQSSLCGRSKELSLLYDALDRVFDANADKGSSEVVHVRGQSGCGKSSIVEKLRESVVERNGFFVSGKFDHFRSQEPFSAIACAFADLCDLVSQSDDLVIVKNALEEALGSEIKVLLNLIGNLSSLTDELPEVKPNANAGHVFTRFKYLCQIFLNCLATANHPVCVFIDDIQWADGASLEVLQALSMHRESSHVLLIFAYRDEKVPAFPFFRSTLETDCKLLRTDIDLGNISLEHVNEIVSHLLEMEPIETMALGELVHRKTSGNPYHVLRFMEMLEAEKFLTYSDNNELWTWDMSMIQAGTNVSDQVGELVASKIQRVPRETQEILKLASCMGFQFNRDLLDVIVRFEFGKREAGNDSGPFNMQYYKDRITKNLDIAIREGLVEKAHRNSFKFTHDHVSSAVYDMIGDEKERHLMHLRIGRQLWKMIVTNKESDFLLFLVADQLIRGINWINDDTEKVRLSRLLFQSGKTAAAKSAFLPASQYLKHAIDLLDRHQRWTVHYELSLDLFSTLSEVTLSRGDFLESKVAVDDVIKNAKSTRDKCRAYFSAVNSLIAQGIFVDGAKEGIHILSELGEQLVYNPPSTYTFLELLRTEILVRRKGDFQLLSLSSLQDEDKKTSIKMMFLVAMCAFCSNNQNLMLVVSLKMMRHSLCYGTCVMTPMAVAAYAFCQCHLGNYDRAFRFGQQSLRLLDQGEKTTEVHAVVLLTNHQFISHFREPLSLASVPLVRGYEAGMATGQTSFALLCALAHIKSRICCGNPLMPIQNELGEFCSQVNALKSQDFVLPMSVPYLAWIHNLSKHTDEPTSLTGIYLDEEDMLSHAMASNNSIVEITICSLRLQLGYYFDELEVAKKMAKKLLKLESLFEFNFEGISYKLFAGLTWLSLYRNKRSRKYRYRATRIIRKVKKWVNKDKASNCYPLLLLLQAELMSLGRSQSVRAVQACFDKAILAARAFGYCHYEALANERAGEYFVSSKDGSSSLCADHYLTEAVVLFDLWGATAKADQLRAAYPHTLSA